MKRQKDPKIEPPRINLINRQFQKARYLWRQYKTVAWIALPLFIILLVPYIKSEHYKKTRVIFTISIVWSVMIQLMGVAFFDGIWHNLYDKGTSNYSWLWSIKNSEIVFNLKRVLFKTGMFSDGSFLIKR